MFRALATMITAGLLVATVLPVAVYAQTNHVTIRDEDVSRQVEGTPPTDNWVIYTRANTPGAADFASGPETPPLGSGSLTLDTEAASDKVWIYTYDYTGTSTSEIDALSYSTYRSRGNAEQVAALNIEVDINGDAEGGYTTLVFEPVYNTDQGTVNSDEWQTWDAINGGEATWWSSRAIPGFPNRDTFKSWDFFLQNNPDAVILGGIGFNQGSGNENLTTAVDGLTVGTSGTTTTFDFDTQKQRPTDKDECKNGGFRNFQTEYKNQGDCVSSVARNQNTSDNGNKNNDSFLSSLRRFFGFS